MLWRCAIIFWCLSTPVHSKLAVAEEVVASVTSHLQCTCNMPLQGITNMTGDCYIQIFKHNNVTYNRQTSDLAMTDRSKILSLHEDLVRHGQKQEPEAPVKWSYEKDQLKFLYSPDNKDLLGLYTCHRFCSGLEYEIHDVKTLTIGQPSLGLFYSFPEGLECKITQRIVLHCHTNSPNADCGCNILMEVSPPVGQGDGDHGKQSQPSWHCEGDKPRSAAQPPATCYLKFWCRKLDCNVKYRCTGRDNSASIFDCCWDQDDSPGECKLQNSVPVVSGTGTDNNQEQSDSAKSQDNNVNHRVAQNTTPAVDHHNDNITDDINSQEHNPCIITDIATCVIGIFLLLLLCWCIYPKLGHIFKAGTGARSQSSSVVDPAANPSSSVQVGAEDNGSIAGHEDGADEKCLPLAGRGIVHENTNFCGNKPGSAENKAYRFGTKFRGGKKRKP